MENLSIKSDLAKLIGHINAAAIPPATENLDEQKVELVELAEAVKRLFTCEDQDGNRVVTLPYERGQEWYVVGDLHADFRSLARILLKIYLRPDTNPEQIRVIFLGDYVDRGERPMQVLRLLFRLKKEWPERFRLLRGNHELWRQDARGEIVSEVSPAETIAFWKPHFGEAVFRKITEAFEAMPVAYLQVVDDRQVLYVHGGIPRKTFIWNDLDSPESSLGFLWSDPEDKEDVADTPSRRFSFGAADFRKFTSIHNIHVVVRGHEAKRDGVDLHEKMLGDPQRLITVFSTGGDANGDSGYGDAIGQPRFLQLDPFGNKRGALFRIEEVYRDDMMLLIKNDRLAAPLIHAVKEMNAAGEKSESLVKTRVLIFDRDAHQRIDGAQDETDCYDNHRLAPMIHVDLRETNSSLIGKWCNGKKVEVESFLAPGASKPSVTTYPLDAIGTPLIGSFVEVAKVFFPSWGRLPEEVLPKLDRFIQRFWK